MSDVVKTMTVKKDGQMARTRQVLNLVNVPRGVEVVARFFREHADDPSDDTLGLEYIEIERSEWEDLGEPETITVTVEPGNTLND